MNGKCQKIQDEMVNSLAVPLSETKAARVEEHRAACSDCRHLWEAIQADDRQLSEFGVQMDAAIAALPAKVLARLERLPVQSKVQSIGFWRGIMHNRYSQLAAATLLICLAASLLLLSNQSAWAEAMSAFDKVPYAHIMRTHTDAQGKVTIENQIWFHLPAKLREETPYSVKIDNGRERLTLLRQEKTAQLGDSLAAEKPLQKHDFMLMFDLFNVPKIKLTRLREEDTDDAEAYRIEGAFLPQTGTGWINRKSRLPMRFTLRRENELFEITFDYDPVPEEVFSIQIPEGYRELPRKQLGAISGKVLDETGQPVTFAEVTAIVGYRAGKGLNGKTDAAGTFSIPLPNEEVDYVDFPLMLLAFKNDVPDRIAWTVIPRPGDRKELWSNVPGRVGLVTKATKVGHFTKLDGMLTGASDIILTLEPAGRINGGVYDADGQPIPGALVTLAYTMLSNDEGRTMDFSLSTWPGVGLPVTYTNAQGQYEITNLPVYKNRAHFRISASATGYVPEQRSVPSTTPSFDIVLYYSGITVSGQVRDNYGKALAGYEICPAVEENRYFSLRAITDDSGRFAIKGCPITPKLELQFIGNRDPRPYTLTPTGQPIERSFEYYPSVQTSVPYEPGKLEYDVDIVVEKPGLTCKVTVKDPDGEPVPQWPLELRSRMDAIPSEWKFKDFMKRTDENGRCVFTNVPRINRLEIFEWRGQNIPGDEPPTPEQIAIREDNRQYRMAKTYPLQWEPGKKEYEVEIVLSPVHR